MNEAENRHTKLKVPPLEPVPMPHREGGGTYAITHTTEYKYHGPVSLCHNIAKLLPRDTDTQVCKSCEIHITPKPDVLDEYEDFYGNKVVYFAIQQEHKSLTVTVKSEIAKQVAASPEFNWYGQASWEEIKQVIQEGTEYMDARQYIAATPMTDFNTDIKSYAHQSFGADKTLLDAALDITGRIYKDFSFKPGFTTITTPADEVFKARKGVCQDFAHLAIACIKSLGLPARYVSGYVETVPPEGEEKLVGVDASHAWFSVFIPGMGWMDFDPTNNIIPGSQHITIGWGRDYADICPLKGVILSSGPHQLHVSVDMRRLG
jgi:transglutaminase-like putative cysteine protease